ncbi:hypothetical protein C1646_756419 [Rhizophagus diaphanus]|nr:hypothetical protein C1646_756419 [Rhizophagus diaphanus] [Rhizophagus sp. MUCL 43196]
MYLRVEEPKESGPKWKGKIERKRKYEPDKRIPNTDLQKREYQTDLQKRKEPDEEDELGLQLSALKNELEYYWT